MLNMHLIWTYYIQSALSAYKIKHVAFKWLFLKLRGKGIILI